MFKKDLKASLIRIFGIQKTTFDDPDENAPEQDVLFVEIADVHTRPYGKDRVSAKVSGSLIVFSQDGGTPYGFFSKRIDRALAEDRKKFIFGREMDITESRARVQNIHEKQMSFTFLYDAQYNPDRGAITSVTFPLGEQE